jgi:hypothetical protein
MIATDNNVIDKNTSLAAFTRTATDINGVLTTDTGIGITTIDANTGDGATALTAGMAG